MTATKLPTDTRPLVQDPDLANAIEKLLEPYSGKQLEKAQAACRRVHGSNILGDFTQIVSAYETAIAEAVGGG